MGTIPMYGACDPELSECLPELFCTPISTEDGGAWICTAQCTDPMLDCDPTPEGWEPVCNGFLHDIGPDPFCAIGCTEATDCPDGMVCGIGVPFSEPLYCYPA